MFTTADEIGRVPSRTFAVDDVESASEPMWTESLSAHVAKRIKRRVVAIPGENRLVINSGREAHINSGIRRREALNSRGLSFGEGNLTSYDQVVSSCHPLIDTVGTAFAQHRPLTLSPDSIWMVIEQGFSAHVLENAETLRSRLVRHEGREELTVKVSDLSALSFEDSIREFSSQIQERTNQVLHETLICNFSTTTQEIRTASEVVLMDCFSSYFSYAMFCVCGIPKVTLTGSSEDWRSIRERVEVFAAYDLEWWLVRLRPILDEFVRTAEGSPSNVFWQAIYKPLQVYGGTSVTGWIGDLFPYLNDAPRRRRNHVFNFPRVHWGVPVKDGIQSIMGLVVSESSFPTGLCSVPVKVKFPDDPDLAVDLLGGFVAVTQDADLALSPVITWAVVEQIPKSPDGVRSAREGSVGRIDDGKLQLL